jgi:WD40 repeat protein
MPGGRLLAMTSRFGLHVLDPDQRLVRSIHDEACGALAFSRDGARQAVANRIPAGEEDARHRVRVFRTADWSVEREWPMSGRGLAWDAQGRLVVVDTPKGVPGRITWLAPDAAAPVRQNAANPGRSRVVTALLNTEADRFYFQLGNQENCFGTLSTGNVFLRRAGFTMEQSAMDTDATAMAFAGEDQALRVWSLVEGTYGLARRGHTGRVLALAFTPDNTGLRSVSKDGTLRSWDLRSDWQSPVGGFRGATMLTGTPLVSPDGGRVALLSGAHVTGQDDAFLLHSLAQRKALGRFYAAPLAWSPDGTWILGLRRESILALHLPTTTECELLRLPGMPQAWLPRVSPDWKWLAWSPDGNSVRVTELPGGRTLAETPAPQAAPAFSPDGTRLAVPGAANLSLLHLPEGSSESRPIGTAPLAVWSPDSALIAVPADTVVRLHDAATGRRLQELAGHRALVCGLAWSPDGRTLAVGCEDKSVHFWNVATSRDALVLTLHTPPVLMGFAGDGSLLIAGGERGYRILETTLPRAAPASRALAFPLPDPASGRPAERPAPPPDPASDDEVHKNRLRALWEAARVYRQQQGHWPDHLSHLRDLLPEPLDRALKSPEAERGSFFWQDDYLDPNFPSPFHYEWCTVLCDPAMGDKDLSWKPDGPVTQREYAEHVRGLYGDKVPFIRSFGKHEEGKLPSILYDGTLALIPDNWQKAYDTGWRPAEWK